MSEGGFQKEGEPPEAAGEEKAGACRLPSARISASVAREVAALVDQFGPEFAATLQLALQQRLRLVQLFEQFGVGALKLGDVLFHLPPAGFEKHRVEVEHARGGGQR